MRIIAVKDPEKAARSLRPKTPTKNKKIVEKILSDVSRNGDSALKRYEERFSGHSLKSLRISKQAIKEAYSMVSKKEIQVIKTAKKRLERTELATKKLLKATTIDSEGTKITRSFRAIQSVGCYVPGGKARYPSSAIMSVVPAKVAGVSRIVVISPCNNQGKIDPLTLVASDICGATEIYKVGGAHGIAALSFGTESINPVDKILGPGGPFVSLAKLLVSDKTPIDMNAGATELGVMADTTSDVTIVSADLISQAEHSEDTFCWVITTSKKVAERINKSIKELTAKSQRKSIVTKSLKKNGFIAVCKTTSDAIHLANQLAPEHLEIMTSKPNKTAEKITGAGLVLLGKNTPSAVSDYLLGSNHILPTQSFGRTRGSLSVLDFLKLDTKIQSSLSALRNISKQMKLFTEAEGLPNHYKTLEKRLK